MKQNNFLMPILLFILTIVSIISLFIGINTLKKVDEKFFSLSGALYGPKEIPDTDTCLCSQLYGSDQTFSKKYLPITKCASCHI